MRLGIARAYVGAADSEPPLRAPLAVISRKKMLPTPNNNYKLPWRWIYSVAIGGNAPVEVATGLNDTTGWAERRAIRVVRDWERAVKPAAD